MAFFGLRGNVLSIVISLVVASAFAMQGYDQAVMNGLVTLPTFLSVFPKMKDSNIEVLANIVARIITGLGVGALTATVPMWVSECSNASERGRRVLLQGLFAIGGLTLAAWIEFGLFFVKDSQVNFRFPIAFQGIFCLIVTSLVMFMPESPRWLIKKDFLAKAREVMSALDDEPEDSEVVTQELDIIRLTFEEEKQNSTSVFTMGPERQFHRAVLAVRAALLAQMTGVNIVTFYSTQIFQQ